MDIIIRFTKFKLTLYSALRFQATVVVMADQNLLDAVNIDKKNLSDTINIDELLDINLTQITHNMSVRFTHDSPAQAKEIEKNKEKDSTISDIEDYIYEKYNGLAMPSLKKERIQEVHLLVQKEENSIIGFLQNQNQIFLWRLNFCVKN